MRWKRRKRLGGNGNGVGPGWAADVRAEAQRQRSAHGTGAERVVSEPATLRIGGGVSEQVMLVCIPKPTNGLRSLAAVALSFAFGAAANWRGVQNFPFQVLH